MFKRNLATICFAVMMLLRLSLAPVGASHDATRSEPSYIPIIEFREELFAEPLGSDFVLQEVDGNVLCRDATSEESDAFNARDEIPLHVISPLRASELSPQAAGLQIILRGTPQLESFPQAKNAFLRAAETWESLIQTPITLIVDVDFGPTRFGQPYPAPNILGSTSPQRIGALAIYSQVRDRLIAQASSQQESAIDNALPDAIIPTDIGNTRGILAPSALFRALGIIGSVADPATETATLGPPPSIGFNSAFPFDFNPDDGIETSKVDFDAVAVHELGHALGFSSNVGNLELNPGVPLQLGIVDLFRVRPGASFATFPTALRIQSSGGAQALFAGTFELELSTGRPDATGGDGRQASHWKDDALTGQYLGIMDPVIPRGLRFTITNNDLLAFDLFGYRIRNTGGDHSPKIISLEAELSGDELTLTGTAADSEGDIAQAQSELFDSDGKKVGQTPPFAVNFGGLSTVSFTLKITNLNAIPAAMQASLSFFDSQGNHSNSLTADFSQADPGGPNLKNASYDGTRLVIKGAGFSNQVSVEINGQVVGIVPSTSSKKVKVKGDMTRLHLRPGPNRLQVSNGFLRSNLLVLNF